MEFITEIVCWDCWIIGETTTTKKFTHCISFTCTKQIWDMSEAFIVTDHDRTPPFEHGRWFNAEIDNKVTIIITNNTGTEPIKAHYVQIPKDSLQIISDSHSSSYDSFQRILFFPLGDDGWHHQLQMMYNKKLMAIHYYAYWIINLENEINNLLSRGCLFQQYVVGMAAKIEGERLSYIQMNQTTLRSTTNRACLTYWVMMMILKTIQKCIILSLTFVGKPR